MQDDQRAFWTAVVQIIPVLALALVIEARAMRPSLRALIEDRKAFRWALPIAITQLGLFVGVAFIATLVEIRALWYLMNDPKPSSAYEQVVMVYATAACIGLMMVIAVLNPHVEVLINVLFPRNTESGQAEEGAGSMQMQQPDERHSARRWWNVMGIVVLGAVFAWRVSARRGQSSDN